MDFSRIVRQDMAACEMTIGILEVFIIGYMMGASISGIYTQTRQVCENNMTQTITFINQGKIKDA